MKPIEVLQLKDPAQRVAPYPLPLAGAEDPAGKRVQQVDRHDPAVDVDDGLKGIMWQRPQVDFGVGLSGQVGQQADGEREAEPHEPHEAGGQPAAPLQEGRHPLPPRRLVRDLERGVRVEGEPPAPAAVPGRRRQRVRLAGPPRAREDALGLAERVPQAEVALVRHEDAEGDSYRHGHDDEGPADPGRVVYRYVARLRDEIYGDGGREGQDGYEGDGQREAEGRRPPVEGVEVEHFGYPDQRRQVVESVVHE